MSSILRNIQIPLFIKVEPGVMKNIHHVLDEHHLNFRKPLIISEAAILEIGGNDAVHALNGPATILLRDNSIAHAEEIAEEIIKKGNDLVVSIGGGRVLDVGKYAATKARVNYISIPTVPSNDGIASPVAALKNENGVTESLEVNMPIGLLVDTEMLPSAPEHLIRCGIGDVISNISAIADWQLAYALRKDSYDDFASSIAYSAAQLIFESCRGTQVDIRSTQFLEKLVHALILSGVAMNIAGNSRPASGSEHKISHAMDALFPERSQHGLQVAYTTLLMEVLRGNDITSLLDFYNTTLLPTSYTTLEYTAEEVAEAIAAAPQTRSDRFTILEERELTEHQIRELIEKTEKLTSRKQ